MRSRDAPLSTSMSGVPVPSQIASIFPTRRPYRHDGFRSDGQPPLRTGTMSVYRVAPVLGDTVDGERGACGDVNDGGEPGGSPSAPARRGSEYAELLRLVRAEGLLDRRLGYYRGTDRPQPWRCSRRGGRCSSGSGRRGGSWSSRRSWRSCSSSSASSATTPAIGRCSAPERHNDLLGILCANLLIGLSYSWWIEKHNRHHANPNHVDRDPDIDAGGVVFTKAQARARRSRIGRWVARHQAVLFFPMLLLEGARSARRQASGPCTHVRQAAPGGSSGAAERPYRRLPRGRVPRPAPRAGGGVHRRPAGPVRRLPGLFLRARPQGDAPAGPR